MKKLSISLVTLLLTIMAFAQERNYYAEAERAFQRCEYAKAAELYRAAYVITGVETDIKRRSCIECAEAQRNAREQKSLGNNEAAMMWYKRILEYNSGDTEAKNFISQGVQQERPNSFNIDKFPTIYSMRNTIECDGVYPGPSWYPEFKNHQKLFYYNLGDKLNRNQFFIEFSFFCSEDDLKSYWEELLTFGESGRWFNIQLQNGHIGININYGDYYYESKCTFKFGSWNHLQISYNRGKIKIKCNNDYDEFDRLIKQEDTFDNIISTIYWGTSDTYKGFIRDITVGSAPKR